MFISWEVGGRGGSLLITPHSLLFLKHSITPQSPGRVWTANKKFIFVFLLEGGVPPAQTPPFKLAWRSPDVTQTSPRLGLGPPYTVTVWGRLRKLKNRKSGPQKKFKLFSTNRSEESQNVCNGSEAFRGAIRWIIPRNCWVRTHQNTDSYDVIQAL